MAENAHGRKQIIRIEELMDRCAMQSNARKLYNSLYYNSDLEIMKHLR